MTIGSNLPTPELLGPWVKAALENPGPLWLLENFIPSQGLVIVSGRPKLSKKSWWCYLAAMSLSTGTRTGPFNPAARMPVLYVNKEGADEATAHRFMALSRSHKIDIADAQMHFMQRSGFFLDDTAHVKDLTKYITLHGIKLVFIDTFAKCFRGDENNARDVGAALRGCEKFRDAGCAVVLVHHIKKERVELIGGIPDPDAGLRGSSAMAGAYDNIISIQDLSIGGDSESWAIVGGKYLDFVGFKQDWKITQDSKKNPATAELTFDGPQELPQVDDNRRGGMKF